MLVKAQNDFDVFVIVNLKAYEEDNFFSFHIFLTCQ